MNFLWQTNLWLLAALPLLPAAYLWLLRRRNTPALRLSSIAVARRAAAPTWRRHVPPAIFLAAFAVLAVALARPTMLLTLPWARSTLMLAIDVSLSMRVADVKPSRMVAAQEAAKSFLQDLPREIEVGLVTFAGSTQVAQQITLDRAAVVGAIDGIQMQYGTALGNAIVLCLAEMFPDHGIELGDMLFGARHRGARSLDPKAKPPPKPITPVAPGSYDAGAIILLSDGRRTTGVDTMDAARMAAERGVRIHVIGLGTVGGGGNGAAAGGPGEFMPIYLQPDEPTLRAVAALTGGEYHHAGTAEDLRGVYQQLGTRVQTKTRETELTAFFALVAAALLALASALSVLWFARIA